MMSKQTKILLIIALVVAVIAVVLIKLKGQFTIENEKSNPDSGSVNVPGSSTPFVLPGQPTPYIQVDPDFYQFYSNLSIKNFSASEVLFKGNSHESAGSSAYGLNSDPPQEKWKNIIETIKILDQFRDFIGLPIKLTSVYRNKQYNAKIGGESESKHMDFNAIDFKVLGSEPQSTYAIHLQTWRDNGLFTGGLKAYDEEEFIHIDTRGVNADWSI